LKGLCVVNGNSRSLVGRRSGESQFRLLFLKEDGSIRVGQPERDMGRVRLGGQVRHRQGQQQCGEDDGKDSLNDGAPRRAVATEICHAALEGIVMLPGTALKHVPRLNLANRR